MDDLIAHLRARLDADRRPPDGLLHCSSDIVGSLRHSQLRAAGAPMLENNLASDFRMKLGTLAHSWLEGVFRGLPVMQEVKMDDGLPDGWSGTADMFVWQPDEKAFLLVDFKTTKPEGIPWIERDGIKHEHHAQASAYWMAARNLGLPLTRDYAILYLPTGQMLPSKPQVAPLLLHSTPDTRVWGVMEERWRLTQEYLQSVSPDYPTDWTYEEPASFITDALAPVQDRVQKLMRPNKDGSRDVLLVPVWYAAYCPFPDELCDCNQQGSTKIGSWHQVWSDAGNWHGHYDYRPRKGYEDVEVTVCP
jgi:hypothetical protein